MKSLIFLVLISLTFSLFSCNKYEEAHSDYARMINNVVDTFILKENSTIQHVAFVKIDDYSSKYAVYIDSLGRYWAINYADYNYNISWSRNFLFNKDSFLMNLTNNGDGTFSCNPGICWAYAEVLPNSMFYGIVFKRSKPSPKDIVKSQTLLEEYKIHQMALNLSENFNLPDKKAYEVSKLFYVWKKVADRRNLINRDANFFSKIILGIDIETFKEAYTSSLNGRSQAFNELIKRVAYLNNMLPKQVHYLVEQFKDYF